MRGLRTREESKFVSFFELVEEEANKNNAVFFLDCGEGNDFETVSYSGEDLRGWLIPKNRADAFETQWRTDDDLESWDDYITWALWHDNDSTITIEFKEY